MVNNLQLLRWIDSTSEAGADDFDAAALLVIAIAIAIAIVGDAGYLLFRIS